MQLSIVTPVTFMLHFALTILVKNNYVIEMNCFENFLLVFQLNLFKKKVTLNNTLPPTLKLF